MKSIKASVKKQCHWIGVNTSECAEDRTKTIEIGLYLFAVVITITMKHMSIKNAARDMAELQEKNILCTDDGFRARLETLQERAKK